MGKEVGGKVTLDKLLHSFWNTNGWQLPTSPGQKERIDRLHPHLEALHKVLPDQFSAAAAQLAYFWTYDASNDQFAKAQKGLEFLVQQVEGGDTAAVVNYLGLRAPWQATIRRSWRTPVRELPKDYANFMLTVLDDLQMLESSVRDSYLLTVWFANGVDHEIGARYTSGLGRAIQSFGIEAVERYARIGFERLKQHPSFQEFSSKHPDYLTTMLGTTLCNFEPETAATLLRSLARRYTLVGLYLYEDNDAKLIHDYDVPENLSMGQHHLLRQGVREEDFSKLEHIVEVRKRREVAGQSDLGVVARLLTYFRVRPGQKVHGALREFSAGDVINVGLSVKYSDVQARKLLESSGFGLVTSYYEGSVGLYLVERSVEQVPAPPVPPNVHASGR